jgi:phosphoribosylaminoimidazole-succinocarboxamide synthase
MLDKCQISELVGEFGSQVSKGRNIEELIVDGELPRLKNCMVQKGKVSDSVFGEHLVTRLGVPIRLMFRNNRISTHDVNRGAIPFKDQVLALNHDAMLKLVGPILGDSQFKIDALKPTSTVIPAENLKLIHFENVLRAFMAESSTSTSLYQNYVDAQKNGDNFLDFGGHSLKLSHLGPNCALPYVMDTPSTKEAEDKTVDPSYLIAAEVFNKEQYQQIRNSSIMAFGIVSQVLKTRNMVLVDTKTEHGINSKGAITVADELYTMDSSRFWQLDGCGNLVERDGKPTSFSKEFARDMVVKPTQVFDDAQSKKIAERYIEGLQHLLDEPFEPDLRDRDERVIESTNLILDELL